MQMDWGKCLLIIEYILLSMPHARVKWIRYRSEELTSIQQMEPWINFEASFLRTGRKEGRMEFFFFLFARLFLEGGWIGWMDGCIKPVNDDELTLGVLDKPLPDAPEIEPCYATTAVPVPGLGAQSIHFDRPGYIICLIYHHRLAISYNVPVRICILYMMSIGMRSSDMDVQASVDVIGNEAGCRGLAYNCLLPNCTWMR